MMYKIRFLSLIFYLRYNLVGKRVYKCDFNWWNNEIRVLFGLKIWKNICWELRRKEGFILWEDRNVKFYGYIIRVGF